MIQLYWWDYIAPIAVILFLAWFFLWYIRNDWGIIAMWEVDRLTKKEKKERKI